MLLKSIASDTEILDIDEDFVGLTQTPLRLERRQYRRTDMDHGQYGVERWEGPKAGGRPFGQLLNLSAGGILIRAQSGDYRVGAQIRIRLRLPAYAGIYPFVSADGSGHGSEEWSGWMTVVRVRKNDDESFEIAGRLVDMRDIDRGMLGLYLSAQPLASHSDD